MLSRVSSLFKTHSSPLSTRSRRSKSRRQTVTGEILETRAMLDASYFALSGGSLSQDWSTASLITANDDWSGVPSIVGFLGQDITTATAVDPRTLTGTSTVANDIDVIANQTTPNTLNSGGVAEFAITNPVVAIQGSGTADVPYLQFHLNTTGRTAVRFQANLRDVDGSTDNAIQQINVQYRVGTTGAWSNVTGGYFADVTTQSTATQVTALDVTLPAPADNQSQVQVRVMTTNAVGNDEWVGIDDIIISSTAAGGDTTPPTLLSMDDNDGDDTVASGDSLTYTVTFSEDIDAATVTAADFDNDGTAGITIGTITETSAGVFSVQVTTTSAGTLRLRISTGSVIEDVAGNDLVVPVSDDTVVTVTAGDVTAPTVTSIADNTVDGVIGVGATVTYTVTFSEDINDGTVSAADFDNAGTSTVTFGTITETSPGVFTIPVTATSAGTVQLRIPTTATILDVAGNALDADPAILDVETITVDGTVPTLTSINDNVSGGPSFTNQPITFTVTFSEDIDAATVTAADFDNAGSSTINVGAVTETSPGVFTVVVTPTNSGTIQLRIPTGSVISDLGGNNLDVTTALLDDTTITINASTTLVAGDIAVIGYNTSVSPDAFMILILTDLLPGTTFFVNDNEIAADGNTSFTDLGEGEASFTVKVGQTITAGTVISLPWGAAAVSTTTYDWSVTTGFGLGNNNEEIYIYTAPLITSTTPTAFIYGVDIGTSPTARPAGLVAGVSFISPTNGGAARYKTGGAIYTGSQANLLAAIGNTATNWEAVAPGATTDWTFVVGSDTTPPTLVSMDDNDGDDTVASGDILTYTVLFSEDIDAATVTAADFNNDGTAVITIGTITETSAGVFSVQVTTTSAGTLRLRIPTGSVIKDVAGNDLVVPVSDDTVVTVTAGDVTAPTVTSIADNTVDGVIGVGATVTYTVTFSEDINDGTVSSADFDNAGTSTVTFGTITETSPGVFTIPVTATSAGTVQLRIPTTATILDVAGNALDADPAILDVETITVDGTVPTLTLINDNVSGGPSFTNQPITFTVTFSEDIDAATVTAADFDNAGSSTINVGAVTETSPGVFTVVVTPTSSGTVRLRIPTGSVISDLGGNNLDVPQIDETVITVNNSALVTGDIAFVGYNGDGNDDFAFVALANIPGGERIVFTDNEWSGTAFNTGEGEIVWTAPAGGVAVGTVIQINNASVVATVSATVGTVAGTLAVGASDEAIFAITGSQSFPTAFLSVITNDAVTGLTSLANTGLIMGVNSIDFSAVDIDADVMAYTGARTSRGTFSAYQRLINTPTNWVTQDATGDQHNDSIAPDVPFSNAGFTLATQSSILLINEVVFNPLAATDTGEEYLELRGTPNTIVPEDAFLVLLDGDSEDGAGNVDHIFDIRGMAFGSNGFLVLRQFGSSYVVDSGSSVFTATSAGWGASWSSRATDIENESVSVLLVQTSVNPIANNDVDTDNNGTLDGAGALWTIRDAIGNIDGGAADTGYGILNTSGNGSGLVPSGSSLINLGGYHSDYMARNGSSTGYSLLTNTSTDWVVGELAGAMPTVSLATGGFTRPAAYEGAALNHIGAVNNFTPGNSAPTNISLSAATLAENAGANAVIGTFSAVDPDSGDTFSFILPVGVDNNNLFNVSGTSLRANASFNFEAGSTYTITARVTDAGGLTFDKQFNISITNVNETPTNIALSATSLAENAGANAVIGTFSATDPDTGDTFSFSLPAGVDNNNLFNVSGTSLRANASFNFEAGSTYTVTARVTDAGGLTFDKQFNISITNVNETPTNIALSATSLAENAGANAVIGTFSATDPDTGDTFSFILPVGVDNNNLFNVSGTSLRANASFNFEAGSTYAVTARVTDAGGLTFDKQFNISITNVNEAPSITSGNAFNAAEANTNGLMGPSTSTTPYLTSTNSNVQFTSIMTVGDAVSGYRMVGIPDGMGAYDNGDGTFTLLLNHEIVHTAGIARAHGQQGAFVSKWVINKSTLQVISIQDFLQNGTSVYLSNNNPTASTSHTAYLAAATTLISRLCSADLATSTAYQWTDPGTGTVYGTTSRIFQSGEESSGSSTSPFGPEAEILFGRQFAFVATDDPSTALNEAGTAWELPHAGLFSWENNLASPFAQRKTIVAGMDDSTGGQVYFWVGDKQTTGNVVERAGLTRQSASDALYVLRVSNLTPDGSGATNEDRNTPLSGAFTLENEGDVSGLTFNQLEALSDTKGGTQFFRPEDGQWDPSNPNDYYFVTTDRYDQVQDGVGSTVGRSRLYRLRFTDITNPTAGGTITAVLDGTEGGNMFDNMTASNGKIIIQEDVGNQQHLGKIWSYDITNDTLTEIAQHDRARFGDVGVAQTAPFSQDEESSGVIDVSDILGAGTYLLNVQAHYNIGDPELVEGGQLLMMRTNVTTGQMLVTTVTATDAENQTLTYSISGGVDAADFVIDPVTGRLSFAVAPNFEAPADGNTDNVYEVTVTVTDGTNPVTQNVQVTVTAVNETPMNTTATTVSVAENSTAVTTVTGTDAEAAVLSYAISGGADAAKFAINPSTGALSFLTAPDFEAPTDNGANNGYFVTVTVSDGVNPPVNKTIVVTVTNANESPAFTSSASVSVPENTTTVGTVTAADPDSGSTLTYSLEGGNDIARFSINPASGVLTFVSAPDFENPTDAGANNVYDVIIGVTDSVTAIVMQPVAVTVTNVNESPVITSGGTFSIAENTTAVTTVTAVDPDAGATLTYSLQGGADAAKFAINPSTGALTFVATPDFELPTDVGGNNVYDVFVGVSDSVNPVVTKAVAVTVTNTNEATFSANIFYNLDADGEKIFSLDRTGQRSIISHIQVVFNGNVTAQAGAVGFTLTKGGAGGGNIGLKVDSQVFDGTKTTVVLGFTGGTLFGSLLDGDYRLDLNYGVIGIDGNGDGLLGGAKTIYFHRFFGDSDGDRDVDASDAARFRSVGTLAVSPPLWRSLFDYDGDGSTAFRADQDDFDAFFGLVGNKHYGKRLADLLPF